MLYSLVYKLIQNAKLTHAVEATSDDMLNLLYKLSTGRPRNNELFRNKLFNRNKGTTSAINKYNLKLQQKNLALSPIFFTAISILLTNRGSAYQPVSRTDFFQIKRNLQRIQEGFQKRKKLF